MILVSIVLLCCCGLAFGRTIQRSKFLVENNGHRGTFLALRESSVTTVSLDHLWQDVNDDATILQLDLRCSRGGEEGCLLSHEDKCVGYGGAVGSANSLRVSTEAAECIRFTVESHSSKEAQTAAGTTAAAGSSTQQQQKVSFRDLSRGKMLCFKVDWPVVNINLIISGSKTGISPVLKTVDRRAAEKVAKECLFDLHSV